MLRQRHANAHTLGGAPPPKTPPPGTPRGEGALRAPWAPSGPRGGRLYATKAIPNGIDLLRRLLYELFECAHVTFVSFQAGKLYVRDTPCIVEVGSKKDPLHALPH